MASVNEPGNAAPTVSVIMPMHNRKQYVRAAIDSILSQSYPDFEFIIVDDGSTDGASDIAQQYARLHKNVVLLQQRKTGLTAALNRALSVARGEFIARMDSDDISLPHRFATQVSFLKQNEDVVAVGGQGTVIDKDDVPVMPMDTHLVHGDIEGALLLLREDYKCGLIHPAVMMRRDAVLAVGGYREAFEPAEDRDLWLRLGEVARLANVPERVILYRIHGECVSKVRAAQQREKTIAAIREAYIRRRIPYRGEGDCRMSAGPPSVAAQCESWAVAAAGAGYHRAARKYGFRAIRNEPRRRRAWKALATGLLGARVVRAFGLLRQSARRGCERNVEKSA